MSIRIQFNDNNKIRQSSCKINGNIYSSVFHVSFKGDQLNCVEYFACQATENVDSGRGDLVRAEKKGRRYRKVLLPFSLHFFRHILRAYINLSSFFQRKWKIILFSAMIVVIVLIIAIYL